jgi:hypothetical protein
MGSLLLDAQLLEQEDEHPIGNFPNQIVCDRQWATTGQFGLWRVSGATGHCSSLLRALIKNG